jgi:hypothetical protein
VAKLIILSIVFVSFSLPIWLATAPRPSRALRKAQTLVFLFVLVWAYLCLHWYPALVTLQ